ncbi:MAG TPA: molybdopterin-dependent oxidoreductase [Gemmatimonadales bacterium]|nr:molybdopterin-dependent oxidoreductase [Gemmatimonadales bacterium]
MKRRKFLQVAGVTTAGLAAGCGTGEGEKWLPYLVPDENLVPGVPTYYASTCRECPAGCGILVKTREGRPIKIEGNPHHPVNRGRLCARGQAALQGLYDPDRVSQPMRRQGERWIPISWDEALQQVSQALAAAATSGQDRVAFIGGADSGPTDALADEFVRSFRSSRRIRYEAFAHEPLREASRLVFGTASIPRYDFGAARYIMSFGADFLETFLSPTEFAGGFARSHGWHEGRMARFVAVEPRRGMTGFSADEWVAPEAGTEALLALGIANAVFRQGRARVTGGDADALRGFLARFDIATVSRQCGVASDTIERLAREFTDAEPSLAVSGGVALQHRQATQLNVAVHLLNAVAGNVGRTVTFPGTVWDRLGTFADLKGLVSAMDAGGVDVVIVHGTNPAFTAGAAGFASAFSKVQLKVALSSAMDETTALCDIVLPDHHPLEAWGLYTPVSGVTSVQQPASTPVHDTRQAADVMLQLARLANRTIGGGAEDAQQLVRRALGADANQELQRGVTTTVAAARPVRLSREFARLSFGPATFDGAETGLVLLTVPSVALYDGRGANKGWLQELPDPATKISWQTWVEVHPQTAAAASLHNGDVVTVTAGERSVEALVYVYPGVRPGVAAMPIGRGHTRYGRYATGGSNPLSLLGDVTDGSGALAFAQLRVTLTPTGRRVPLATTEGSPRQHGRGIARLAALASMGQAHEVHEPFTAAERRAIARADTAHREARYTLGDYRGEHPKWEMAIDLSRCTGCSACVTACYAENNLPVVGESQVQRHREMAWIRLERYFEGETEGTDFQVAQVPMLCQQCENAPCEPVCPVYAAYHTPDGLNGQIYNRCVGTRYCANNCPYKVRYFNWFDYGSPASPQFAFPGTLAWQLNPDVTVRTKGVMEKCTFCVQRIRYAQNEAKVSNRALTDADVQPACAQTCPADAITFGDARNPDSEVSRRKRDERGYHVFELLNTKPGVTYLTRVVHAEMAEAASGEGH